MNNLSFLADVNISPVTVTTLQQQGYDILRVTDLLTATTTDVNILEFARREVCLVQFPMNLPI
jgi:predicted nuclease of predicted toxin-antitoxin system